MHTQSLLGCCATLVPLRSDCPSIPASIKTATGGRVRGHSAASTLTHRCLGAWPQDGWSDLHVAVDKNDSESVSALLAQGADVNKESKVRSPDPPLQMRRCPSLKLGFSFFTACSSALAVLATCQVHSC